MHENFDCSACERSVDEEIGWVRNTPPLLLLSHTRNVLLQPPPLPVLSNRTPRIIKRKTRRSATPLKPEVSSAFPALAHGPDV